MDVAFVAVDLPDGKWLSQVFIIGQFGIKEETSTPALEVLTTSARTVVGYDDAMKNSLR